MVILKNAYHAKPESLLIATALALSVAVLATDMEKQDGQSVPAGGRVGIIAGFGVATKLTAAPIFLLPIFLLGGWRGIAAYGLAAAAASRCFSRRRCPSPRRRSRPDRADHAGAYGGGAKGTIDFAAYPAPSSVSPPSRRPSAIGFGAAALAIAFGGAGAAFPSWGSRPARWRD